MIERHGCARKQLLCFSAGGKKHKHAVVLALYYDLLRRIESKKVTHTYPFSFYSSPSSLELPPKVILSKALSIIESVMPKRRAWRGVGGAAARAEMFERFTMLCTFIAWKWSMTKSKKSSARPTKNKKHRFTHPHSITFTSLLTRSWSYCLEQTQ